MIFLLLLLSKCEAADYTAAIEASKQAILIQSGAMKFKADLENYFIHQINAREELAYPYLVYNIYKQKSFKFKINNKSSIILDTYPSFTLNINF